MSTSFDDFDSLLQSKRPKILPPARLTEKEIRAKEVKEEHAERREAVIDLCGGWRPKPGQEWCCMANPAVWISLDGDDDD